MNTASEKGDVPWQAYFWKTLGVFFMASGPPVFMYISKDISLSLGVMHFLTIGGLATLITGFFKTRHSKESNYLTSGEHLSRLLEKSTFAKMIAAGVLFAAHFTLYIAAMQEQSVTEAMIVIRTSSVLVVVLSIIFLKDKIEGVSKMVSAMILCFLGVVVVMGVDSFVFTYFLLLAFLSAFCTASFQVITVSVSNREKRLSREFIVGVAMLIGGVSLFFWTLLVNGELFLPKAKVLFVLLYIGVATCAVPSVTNLVAVKLAGAQSRVALIEYFQVPFGSVLAFCINGERGFDYWNLAIGFVFILIGAYMADRSVKK